MIQHRMATPATQFSRILVSALPLLALVLSTQYVRADGTLVIELPPSEAAREAQQQAQATERARQKAATAKNQSGSRNGTSLRGLPGDGRGAFASRHQNGAERPLGRLGEVQITAPIRRTRSADAPKLTTTGEGTYLAIKDEQGDWYGVLMADGSLGWIVRSAVKVLDYEVISTASTLAQQNSQGGSNSVLPSDLGGNDIYPRSNRPYFNASPQAFWAQAQKYLGVPYVWGGNTYNGIDCSGFVKNVYEALGFPLPRLGSDQMAYGIPVPPDQLQPGDRLYFTPRTERLGVHHTGLYIGNGYFIHASSGKHQVAVSSLTESYYRKNYVCARR